MTESEQGESISGDGCIEGSVSTHVVTPRLWGGFRMPWTHETPWGEYHPAIGQIWIRADLRDRDLVRVVLHEGRHRDMAPFRPARMGAICCELAGRVVPPAHEEFEDLVELACIIRSEAYAKRARIPDRYRDMHRKLVRIARRFSRRASKKLQEQEAIREALLGFSAVLLSVHPTQPNLAATVVDAIGETAPPPDWQLEWQVGPYICDQIKERLQDAVNVEPQYVLADANEHNAFAHILFFLALAVRAIDSRPDAITAVFPSLIEAMTLGALEIAPVLWIEKTKRGYRAKTTVSHTTVRSQSIFKALRGADPQYNGEELAWFCPAKSIVIALVRRGVQYSVMNTRNRTQECFRSMLHILPRLLEERFIKSRGYACVDCECIFNDPEVRSATEAIMGMSSEARRAMLATTKAYESWLSTDAMAIVRDTWHLSHTPSFVRNYSFL